MAKYNTPNTRTRTTSPIGSQSATPDTLTYNKGLGFTRDAVSELFLLCVGRFAGQDSFYESESEANQRLTNLIGEVIETPNGPEWLSEFLPWLRTEGFMRTAPVVCVAEIAHYYHARGRSSDGLIRKVTSAVLRRPDEPGELIAYYRGKYGRKLPIALSRGIADALPRLYTERNVLRYDTASHGYRFGDVIDLVRPDHTPGTYRSDLYRYCIERRHNRNEPMSDKLTLLGQNRIWNSVPVAERRERFLINPEGATESLGSWESVAGWLQGPMSAEVWEALIPTMGYMALLRNLRNFENAGISNAAQNAVIARLGNPDEVARSKQFPFRFLSAYKAVNTLAYAFPLEQALSYSLANVPQLPGRTLILVDRSDSMFHYSSDKTGLTFADTAAVFGSALAVRAESADLVEFGNSSRTVKFNAKADSLLRMVNERFSNLGGTETTRAVRHNYNGHDRVVIVTDEQYGGWSYWASDNTPPGDVIPAKVPLYTWNLLGYKAGQSGDKPLRYTFGGMNGSAFRMISMVEAGRDAVWPWQNTTGQENGASTAT